MPQVLLYDADCAFCTRSVALAPRLGCRVEAVPFQTWPDLAAFAITPEAAEKALHLVAGTEVLIGHEAVAGALLTSTNPEVRAAGRVLRSRPLRPVASRAYAWVAAHRHQLPGGTAACALDQPTTTATTGDVA